MGGFSLEGQVDSGVKPDVETKISRKDLIEGIDVELRTVLKLIDNE